MSRVDETKLPGMGMRYEFVTADGARLGVVHHRTGARELLIFEPNDPDTCREVVSLDEDDARTLAEILGTSKVAENLATLHQIEGLAIDWLPVVEGTPFVGRTIGDTGARTRTGVSIVAVVRGAEAIAAPGPEQELRAGDSLVVVGTARGIESLAVILRTG